MQKIKSIPYDYYNLPIPGGGYVTGLIFHRKEVGLLYARTDIGGVYRYCYEENRWHSLMNHVTMQDLSESFPIAIALDDSNPEKLYIACGVNEKGEGVLALSDTRGETFTYRKIPASVHGNLNGRGTGARLIKDALQSKTLYFASQKDGLLKSQDEGVSWESLEVGGEKFMTFVWQSIDGKVLVVGTAGVTTKVNETRRGHSLYISYDKGNSFEELIEPSLDEISSSKMAGYVAQRYDADEKYLYITFSQTGRNAYVIEEGYSCDSGDVTGGKVVRYPLNEINETGKLLSYEEITPYNEVLYEGQRSGEKTCLEYGFSGISACPSQPGLLVCTTICKKEDGKDVDSIYLSRDYGDQWQEILADLNYDNLIFHSSYMKPEYNGGHSILHWMSDIKINPFNHDEAWINSGTGIFRTTTLTHEKCLFEDWCQGLEETVHLNLYSPPAGNVQLIDILGDLGGFAFNELDKPCENSFSDEADNRYITCINADYSDFNPNVVIVTPRGNWTGKTKGGLILSEDGCQSFTRLKMPYGLSKMIDERLERIESPNVNSGWVALSSDGEQMVWSIAEGITLPMNSIVYSKDKGKSFAKTKIYNLKKERIETGLMKVFSDRVDRDVMYGFGSQSEIYISQDGGASFDEYELTEAFPKLNFGLIDCANQTEVRGEAGKRGIFYLALGKEGLWKMIYKREEEKLILKKLTKASDEVYRMGLGILRAEGNYLKEDKAIYICGKLNGVYGFYCSLDDGVSWMKLNTEKQMFGDINSIEGDSRSFGRFFIGTGSRGVLYGEPIIK